MASEIFLGGAGADGLPITGVKVVHINPATGAVVTPATQDTGANRVVLYDSAGNAVLVAQSSNNRASTERGLLVDARGLGWDNTNSNNKRVLVNPNGRQLVTYGS